MGRPKAPLNIELHARPDQTAFNLRRRKEILANTELGRELARYEGRIETDRHGNLIMYPPPGTPHGGYQAEITHLLRVHLPDGRVTTECPVSTADGVKGVDVTWVSRKRLAEIDRKVLLSRAPEICVEVISPSNSKREMEEKKALFFAAGAREVWFCDKEGKMTFFVGAASRGAKLSKLCPPFPRQLHL